MTGTYVTRVYSLLGESSSSLRFLDRRTRILYGTFLQHNDLAWIWPPVQLFFRLINTYVKLCKREQAKRAWEITCVLWCIDWPDTLAPHCLVEASVNADIRSSHLLYSKLADLLDGTWGPFFETPVTKQHHFWELLNSIASLYFATSFNLSTLEYSGFAKHSLSHGDICWPCTFSTFYTEWTLSVENTIIPGVHWKHNPHQTDFIGMLGLQLKRINIPETVFWASCVCSTHTPWIRLWTLMVYSLVTTSLMAERPFFFSPFLVGAI